MNPQNNNNNSNSKNEQKTTSRTLDIKPKSFTVSKQEKKANPPAKVPPIKKKIIKFHFANPFEYKMFKNLVFQKYNKKYFKRIAMNDNDTNFFKIKLELFLKMIKEKNENQNVNQKLEEMLDHSN